MQSKVKFIGKVQFNKDDSKLPPFRKGKTKTGLDYISMNMAIVNDTNRVNVELFGMKPEGNIVGLFDNENNKVEIDADDRFDESVISSIRPRHILSIGEDRNTFLTPWDMINCIKENREELTGKKVCVTGSVSKNVYQGNISDRFQIRNIYVVDEETKPGFTVTEEIFFKKDSIDTADWKDEKKVRINCFVESYDSDSKENKYYPRDVVFDCSKVDFENENHLKVVNFRLKQIGLAYEDGKIVNNLKSKKIYKIVSIENYVNGTEEVPFDESTLTPNQKEAIALGVNTIDDFRPNGKIYGNRIVEYKLTNFDLTGDYSDGCVVEELTEDEFEEKVYISNVAEETTEELLDSKPAKSTVDADDLFS